MVHQSLMSRLWGAFSIASLAVLAACSTVSPPVGTPPANDDPPAAPREFRAAWVATVANIDWPSRKDLSVAQQQAEIIAMLDRAQDLKLNAIILQVRTGADALYKSDIEPWSEYLTGAQGRAPEPLYDPLTMWVTEAHKRGLELHAWFNPYRARHNRAGSPPAANHVANTMPHAVKSYGGYLWMDPGEEAASEQTLRVILDVVKRYDIDGVHIDDYFYPYPVPALGSETPPPSADDTPAPRAELAFPDDPAWFRYVATGGNMARADWRRQNVNGLIERIYAGIKTEKRWVKFGISPFGLGKPDNRPATIKGFSQYDKLYADAELWLQKGWLDYFTPQLYWAINQESQAFPVLLDSWIRENTLSRHLWPGIYTTRILAADANGKSWEPAEIVEQIGMIRERTAKNPITNGHVHFSMVGLMQNRRGINDQLGAAHYTTAALVPATPWLGDVAPDAPTATASVNTGDANTVDINVQAPSAATQTAVWGRHGTTWRFMQKPARGTPLLLPRVVRVGATAPDEVLNAVVISAVDRLGNESARVRVALPK